MKTDQLTEVIQTLAREGIQSVYVEGGPTLANAFMNNQLVNKVIEYLSPQFLGKAGTAGILPSSRMALKNLKIEQLSNNLRIVGEIDV